MFVAYILTRTVISTLSLCLTAHKHINDVLGGINPTAENMAKWIADELGPKCFKVEVQESEGNVAIYERD